MYRLAFESNGGSAHTAWEYGAVPGTGEVRLWRSDGRGGSSFVNSSISQWLCALHLVGTCFAESAALGRYDESVEAEDQAVAELADLLRRIEAIDPAAIADGDHERQFWPAVLDRWLFLISVSFIRLCHSHSAAFTVQTGRRQLWLDAPALTPFRRFRAAGPCPGR